MSSFSLSCAIFAPAAVKKSALPDLLDTALLPCFVTEAPLAAATNEDAVEQLNVCRPDPPVPQVSIWSSVPTSNLRDLSRITDAAADISVSVMPFAFNSNKKFSISISSTAPVIILFMACCISKKFRSNFSLS